MSLPEMWPLSRELPWFSCLPCHWQQKGEVPAAPEVSHPGSWQFQALPGPPLSGALLPSSREQREHPSKEPPLDAEAQEHQKRRRQPGEAEETSRKPQRFSLT